MKRLAIILTCLAAAACGRYLDVRPQGYVIPSTDAEFASVMHKHLQDIEGGGDEIIIGNMETLSKLEGCADDLDANITVGNLKAYAGELINNRMTEYCNYYEIIRDCNIVIGNLDGRSSRLASDVLSCAYAIKGICYYDLIRMYCEAPEEGPGKMVDGFGEVRAVRLAERGEDEDARLGPRRQQALRRLRAVDSRHDEVHDDDVGTQLQRLRDARLAVGGVADDLQVGLAVQKG